MRRGTVLVVISGVVAVIAAVTVAFLVEMRSDQEESQALVRTAQARAMLTASLQYVAETSRLGWDTYDFSLPPSATNHHVEAFGWVDVRDGQPGPRDQDGNRLFAGDAAGHGMIWPAIGGVARCPTYAMRIPPWAVSMNVAPNPIPPDPGKSWAELVSFTVHDPQRVAGSFLDAAAPSDFVHGDPRPIDKSVGRSWFRVLRTDAARFTLTCAAGATQGFRTWKEVQDAGEEAEFGDEAAFTELRMHETVLWFATEWSPAVSGADQGFYAGVDGHTLALNRLSSPQSSGVMDRPNVRQFGGTFTYIQRLFTEPTQW